MDQCNFNLSNSNSHTTKYFFKCYKICVHLYSILLSTEIIIYRVTKREDLCTHKLTNIATKLSYYLYLYHGTGAHTHTEV